MANEESIWNSDTEIFIWSVTCDQEEVEVILNDPNQMSLIIK